MDRVKILKIAESIMSQPTAPFREEAVRAEIVRLLTGLPGVTLEQDGFGNVIARYQRGPATPQFAFVAHMDHPGYVDGEFLGGLPERYRQPPPSTRQFGSFAMLDLPAFEVRDERIYSRACDDLIGCTAIVAALVDLSTNERDGVCLGVFTRAEEVGFVGAIQLAKAGIIDRDIVMISLEASDQNAGTAKMGEGVVVRVGDKMSVFDSKTSLQLTTVARDNDIPNQRSLMQGGSCEATAFQVYGYRSAALCVPIGHYHNQGPDNQVAAEYVSVDDTLNMALLCSAMAQSTDFPDPYGTLRDSFENRCEKYRGYF